MPKLQVKGTAKLRVNYTVEVPYTEEQWEALGWQKQNVILDSAINWHEVCSNAEVDDIDVDDYQEMNE